MADTKDASKLSQEELEAVSGGTTFSSQKPAEHLGPPPSYAAGAPRVAVPADFHIDEKRTLSAVPDAGSKKGFEKLLWNINRFFGK